jgi:uncharacterized membrane protein YcaP (DUF421 family)
MIAILQVATSYLSFRIPRLRPVLDGLPIVVVEDGKAIEKNLHRERITLEELTEQMRLQQIGSLEEVQWAVLETSGTISFIQKSQS